MPTIKEKQKKVYEALKEDFAYRNPMQTPRLNKIVISTGIGSITDRDKLELIVDRIERITGQHPSPRAAKKSIASFGVREGDTIGHQVTLRGKRMNAFLEKLIHIALPRTKDFRGITPESIDEMGNLTIGIKEHTVFPETSDEELKNIFGLAVTLVTTAQDKKEALAYLKELGVPFREEE